MYTPKRTKISWNWWKKTIVSCNHDSNKEIKTSKSQVTQ